jgi:hypothetical protein
MFLVNGKLALGLLLIPLESCLAPDDQSVFQAAASIRQSHGYHGPGFLLELLAWCLSPLHKSLGFPIINRYNNIRIGKCLCRFDVAKSPSQASSNSIYLKRLLLSTFSLTKIENPPGNWRRILLSGISWPWWLHVVGI